MSGALPLPPQLPSRRGQGPIYLYLYYGNRFVSVTVMLARMFYTGHYYLDGFPASVALCAISNKVVPQFNSWGHIKIGTDRYVW
jgi:hypothetical protein